MFSPAIDKTSILPYTISDKEIKTSADTIARQLDTGSAFSFPKVKGRMPHTPTPKTPKTPSFDQPTRTKEEILGRRKKLVNNTSIPQHTIETIARCIFPDILAYYESEEGQREFAEWKAEQEHLKTSKDNSSSKSVR